ncbi:MAG: hypothetical protein B7X04_03210 [Parcubacteria group bacterium 21-54-25]|nr:MAG: hypothetical protein B7X04_03210 [Parcubacteria group bacterium 21-54-25]
MPRIAAQVQALARFGWDALSSDRPYDSLMLTLRNIFSRTQRMYGHSFGHPQRIIESMGVTVGVPARMIAVNISYKAPTQQIAVIGFKSAVIFFAPTDNTCPREKTITDSEVGSTAPRVCRQVAQLTQR